MDSRRIETLKRVNRALRIEIVRFQPERNHCLTVQPREVADLRHQLEEAAECLRNSPMEGTGNTPMAEEIEEYIGHLTKLREFLPGFHGRLSAEKSRLEEARNLAASAAAWTNASKRTL